MKYVTVKDYTGRSFSYLFSSEYEHKQIHTRLSLWLDRVWLYKMPNPTTQLSIVPQYAGRVRFNGRHFKTFDSSGTLVLQSSKEGHVEEQMEMFFVEEHTFSFVRLPGNEVLVFDIAILHPAELEKVYDEYENTNDVLVGYGNCALKNREFIIQNLFCPVADEKTLGQLKREITPILNCELF